MLKKHAILLGITVALLLLYVATLRYPGGNQHDSNAPGFSWQHNYLSNLFGPKAVNGANNAAQPWAVAGMFFLAGSIALFFIQFSGKIPTKGAAGIVKYCGAGGMLFAFLAVTPYHNIMITIAGTLTLVSIFYVTVFVFKSKLHRHKILCIVYLIAAYSCNYIYYTRNFLEILPVMQKVAIAITIIWMLSLHYFSTKDDFKLKEKKVRVSA